MRLDELNYTAPIDPEVLSAAMGHFQKNPSGDRYHNSNPFEKLGWFPHGGGRMSDVYVNPEKDFALKINRKYDRAFAWFVLITKKFPNIHFPNVGNMKLIKINDLKYYIYLIEKLQPIQYPKEIPIELNVCRSIMRHPNASLDSYTQDMARTMMENSALVKALKTIGKNIGYFRSDLTMTNMMKRSNGTIVITDPLSD